MRITTSSTGTSNYKRQGDGKGGKDAEEGVCDLRSRRENEFSETNVSRYVVTTREVPVGAVQGWGTGRRVTREGRDPGGWRAPG